MRHRNIDESVIIQNRIDAPCPQDESLAEALCVLDAYWNALDYASEPEEVDVAVSGINAMAKHANKAYRSLTGLSEDQRPVTLPWLDKSRDKIGA